METPEIKVELSTQTNLRQEDKDLEEENECEVLGCVTDKLIKCPGCNYKSCLKCIQTFILKNNKTECINCKRVYDELHLRNMFSKYWMTKHYTKWRKEKLLESEKSFMIETMEYIDVEKRIDQFKKYRLTCQSELIDVKSKIIKLKKDIKTKEKETVSKKLSDEIKEVKKTELEGLQNNLKKIILQSNKLESRINVFKNAVDPWYIQRIESEILDHGIIYKRYTLEEACQYADSRVDDNIEFDMKTKSAIVKTNSYIKPCPAKDCKGFISSKYKCGICEIKICKDCHEIVEEDIKSETEVKTEEDEKDSTHQTRVLEHTCNKDDIESAKAILKETKSCPKCAVRVYKIDGCDQMYCTQCHTAFSWTSGKIVTGTIHNPHYFEYLRNNNLNIPRFEHPDAQQGGAQVANACLPIRERFIRFINSNKSKFTVLIDKVNNEKIENNQLLTNIDNIIRLNTHIRRVVIRENQNQDQLQPQVQTRPQNQIQVNVERNRDLRIKYLNNETDEESFMKVAMKRYKEDEYEKSANKILETFMQVTEDILNDIYYNKINAKFEEYQKETLKNMISKKKTNNDNNLLQFYMEDLFVDYFKLVNYMNNETDKITSVFDYTTNKYYIKIKNPTNSKYKNVEHLIHYADIQNSILSTI